MQWKFNGLISCHELESGGEVLARIYQSEKRDPVKRPFRTRSLISAFLYGERRLERLARRNKEWVSNRRDFASDAERKAYLERRKAEILRFVDARQREMG